eukprot:CAMPEP_0119335856 /NCGR_PEP_ID=MMETSP1333-20130426/90528_1 /TAXON_ID=418940 /ORGANISM="Scyphosphaera apsteinii, Strain RCC1455" /LENGTH=138 /DNA_ID=CAMNT_0007346523 /DNA_START=150 /DNA_END=563 /DNA_ORIENTATION=+
MMVPQEHKSTVTTQPVLSSTRQIASTRQIVAPLPYKYTCNTFLAQHEDEREAVSTVASPIKSFGTVFFLLVAFRIGLRPEIRVGDIAVSERPVPSLDIAADEPYDVIAIYYQGFNGTLVERIPVDKLSARAPPGCEGW